MTYSDYSILQEDFSNHLYQNKFGNCVNNREEAFDEAILADHYKRWGGKDIK